MTTLVSGFIDRSRYDPVAPPRPVEFYLMHGKELLMLDRPKVVFLEPHVIELLRDVLTDAPTTVVVPFEKEELEFWSDRERFLACPRPPGAHPVKDSHDYLMIQLNKVDWCMKAARLNPFGTALFTWVDFGIGHILRGAPLASVFDHLRPDRVSLGTVRIPGCAHFYPPMHPAQLVWKYCGGLFCGDLTTLERFQKDQRTVVLALLDQGFATWEVTVWYYMNAPYLDRYLADHNETMFTQF
jgi:hypothetical protein